MTIVFRNSISREGNSISRERKRIAREHKIIVRERNSIFREHNNKCMYWLCKYLTECYHGTSSVSKQGVL